MLLKRWGQLCCVQLADGFGCGVALLQLDLGGGQVQQAGGLQRADAGDLLPMLGGVGPAVLLLADLGQRGVALGFVRQGFDDRREGPFGVLGRVPAARTAGPGP
jgi:hypothetical protein